MGINIRMNSWSSVCVAFAAFGAAFVFVGAPAFAGDAANESEAVDGIVRSISVETTRVRESVVRRTLVFEEGDLLTDELLRRSRRRLYDLNLFKTLDIDVRRDPGSDEVDVAVEGEDGWFGLPWPIVGSRGGSRYAMLSLMQYNYFRRAESIALLGILRDDELSGLAAWSVPDYSIVIGSFRSLRREHVYADGAFSIKDFKNAFDGEKAGDFGATVNAYDKKTHYEYLTFTFPVGRQWKFTLSGRMVDISHADAEEPESLEDERISSLSASAQYGTLEDGMSSSAMIPRFGRLFGLGMAAVEEELKARIGETRTYWSGRLSMDYATGWLGSDNEALKISARLDRNTRFGNRGRLRFFGVGACTSAPSENHWLPTSRENGLSGVYAREYRGDTVMSAGTSYQRPFAMNRIGNFSANVFAEYSAVLLDGQVSAKEGVGARLTYQFWRFPFPMGFGYTYSLDDDNGQYSFAMGGMF